MVLMEETQCGVASLNLPGVILGSFSKVVPHKTKPFDELIGSSSRSLGVKIGWTRRISAFLVEENVVGETTKPGIDSGEFVMPAASSTLVSTESLSMASSTETFLSLLEWFADMVIVLFLF
jgi:hypothetical protein